MLPPRLEPDEIEYFRKNIDPAAKVVEWGSGGSTFMFLDILKTGELISVEHNLEWKEKVVEGLGSPDFKGDASRFTLAFRPPEMDIRFYGYGVPMEENPAFAASYINPDDKSFGDFTVWDADIFFVDGICRGAVLASIRAYAYGCAIVYLHDHHGPENREEWYRWAIDLYSNVERVGTTLLKLSI